MILEPTKDERLAIRLAAVLHNVGHSPFSHATEHLICREHQTEFDEAIEVIRRFFDDVGTVRQAEAMAVFFVLSDAMKKVLDHPRFDAGSKSTLGESIAARILGSTSFLNARYLSGVLSGPLDADKIDYMARDSHHAGLPLGLDITRLVSKLEVVAVTADNALSPEVKKCAEEAPGKRFYELGISKPGLGAYEQFVIARVTLYERLYYHQKVRAAEGMVRNLADLVASNGKPPEPSELYQCLSDDTLIDLWGGTLKSPHVRSGTDGAAELARQIRERQLFKRAYAFSARYIAGIGDHLEGDEADDARGIPWSGVTGELEDFEGTRNVAEAIVRKATAIGAVLPEFADEAKILSVSNVVVDLPQHRRVAKTGREILVTTETNHIGTPNMFFHSEKWSAAYMKQKQCGYVFAPPRFRKLVALASKLVFFERFGIVMGEGADIAAKMHREIDPSVYDRLSEAQMCTAECVEMLKADKPRLMVIRPEHIKVPQEYAELEPDMRKRLAAEIRAALPGGLPVTVHKQLVEGIYAMLKVVHVVEQGGRFKHKPKPDEVKEFQPEVRDALKYLGVALVEGSEYAGGETDLLLWDTILVENKVLPKTADPFANLGGASWQARRYRLSLASKVCFICVGYEPATENDRRHLNERVRARRSASSTEEAAEIVFLFPCGGGKPSGAAGGAPTSSSPHRV